MSNRHTHLTAANMSSNASSPPPEMALIVVPAVRRDHRTEPRWSARGWHKENKLLAISQCVAENLWAAPHGYKGRLTEKICATLNLLPSIKAQGVSASLTVTVSHCVPLVASHCLSLFLCVTDPQPTNPYQNAEGGAHSSCCVSQF